MVNQLFRAGSTNSTIVFTGQAFNRSITSAGANGGTNGSSVVLAAGLSASGYATSSAVGITGASLGDWKIGVSLQNTITTQIFTKVRVHRISVSGTTPTILASSTYTAEINTRRTISTYSFELNQVDLGSWSSTDRFAIEYTFRNAGSSSFSPQPAFGPYHLHFIYAPIDRSTIGYNKGNGNQGQRAYIYSRGGIRGTIRNGNPTSTETISSGSATGSPGGINRTGSASGQSTSTGVSSGKPGLAGQISGTSISTGAASGSQISGGSFEFPPYEPPTKPKEHMAGIAQGYILQIGRSYGRAGISGNAIGSFVIKGKTNGVAGQAGATSPNTIYIMSRKAKGKKVYPIEQKHLDEMLLAEII